MVARLVTEIVIRGVLFTGVTSPFAQNCTISESLDLERKQHLLAAFDLKSVIGPVDA